MSSALHDLARIFAIVPVKPLDEGKSRLRAILTDEQRLELNSFLLQRTFEQVARFPGASQSIAVSRDEAVLAAAAARGLIPLQESGSDLNAALIDATSHAISRGATGVLVLPVDLPMLCAAAIRREIEQCGSPICLIAPDRRRRGTNVLYLSPPQLDLYRFGPDSFQKHQAAAIAKGLPVAIIDDASFALDIDEPADYRLWDAKTHP
jgi:2-phospho-L-lactate guanylyltransferase